MLLVGRSLHKTFDDRAVLHDVSIEIVAGKITALMGPSGAGKTTLLRALSLVEPADKGTIEIDAQMYVGSDERRWPGLPWPAVTVVFQDLFLWPHMTNLGNVRLALGHTSSRVNHQYVSQICSALRIEDLLQRFPSEISRGQRQLVALARAIVLKPRYLLLDEISSSLDVERASLVGSLLRAIAKEGTGVLLITHQPAFARHSCDVLSYMAEGRIVEAGPPEILDDPKSADLKAFVNSVNRAL